MIQSTSYIAGLMDNACTACYFRGEEPVIEITQSHPELLDAVSDFLETGEVVRQQKLYSQSNKFMLAIKGEDAVKRLLTAAIPSLKLSRESAVRLLLEITGEEGFPLHPVYKKVALADAEDISDEDRLALKESSQETDLNYKWFAGFLDSDRNAVSCPMNPDTGTMMFLVHVPVYSPHVGWYLEDHCGGTFYEDRDYWVYDLLERPAFLAWYASETFSRQEFVGGALSYFYRSNGSESPSLGRGSLDWLRSLEYNTRFAYTAVDDYQAWTRTTAKYPESEALSYLTMGLTSEAGEVAGVVKKLIRDSGGEMSDEKRAKLIMEISDCMWYVARLLDHLHINLSDVLTLNAWKLEDRLKRNVIAGDGDHR